MKIKITFQGMKKLEEVESGDTIEVGEASSISDLLTRFLIKEEFHPFIIPMVNGQHADLDYVFKENDEVDLFLPVSGG